MVCLKFSPGKDPNTVSVFSAFALDAKTLPIATINRDALATNRPLTVEELDSVSAFMSSGGLSGL